MKKSDLNAMKKMHIGEWKLEMHAQFEEYELRRLSALHPDERCIRLPERLDADARRIYGVEQRRGLGHILPDGCWYDPVDDAIFCVETIQ